MLIFKKTIFGLPFLIFLAWFFFELNAFFKDSYLIFSFDISTLIQLIWLLVSLSLASFCFIIFAALSDDWKFILPVSILGALSSFALLSMPAGLAMWVGTFLSLLLTHFMLSKKLKTYLTFQASALLNPSIKTLATLLIVTASLGFYLSAQIEIKTNGFKLPDSIIDTALKFSTSQMPNLSDVKGVSIAQVTLTPEQIQLLKQNPGIAKQYGIDVNSLDQLGSTQSAQKSGSQPKNSSTPSNFSVSPSSLAPSSDMIKGLIQTQIQGFIKPYEYLVPIFLAGLFFVTMQSLFSILGIFFTPLIALTFWILTKTGFIHFETEMREVKKLVV